MPGRPRVKALSLLLAIVWLASFCFAYQSAAPSPEAKKRYSEARRLFAVGEKQKAIEELKAVIQLAPEYVEAHRDFLDNQFEKAESLVEQYEAYVKQNPNSAVYRYLLGKAYSNANKREKSDAEFKKSLELDPNFAWAMVGLSNVATRAGDNARSIQLLEQASKHAGDSVQLRAVIANNIINKKMYDQALKESERILQIDPQYFDAYTTKWQARLSLTLGADITRAEVMKEIQDLETNHAKEIRALLVVQSGYQMLEDEKGAERAKKAILVIDPQYYARQPYNMSMGTASGKIIRFTGPSARLFSETFRMKDDRQKLEAYARLEKDLTDADAKMYALYPAMLRSYVALKDIENGERVIDLMIKGNIETRELASHRVTLARAMFESGKKFDAALDHTRLAVEQLRQPLPKRAGSNAEPSEYAKEQAKKQLAAALHLHGQLLLEKGMTAEAVAALDESVKLNAQEESLFDLGRAYAKVGKADEAIDALTKAYAYEGKRQPEARASLKKIYGSREKSRPLDGLLSEAVDRQRAVAREAAIKKAVLEISKTEPKEAPAFSLTTLAGEKVQLQDLRGKVLLLNFWATW